MSYLQSQEPQLPREHSLCNVMAGSLCHEQTSELFTNPQRQELRDRCMTGKRAQVGTSEMTLWVDALAAA